MPAASASAAQCASAPARPPRLPPWPGFLLVTKKLALLAAPWASATAATTAVPANTPSKRETLFIGILLLGPRPSIGGSHSIRYADRCPLSADADIEECRI